MIKIREFFVNLKKSTKITMISCGCFIALTVIILFYFILFPYTPSDKVLKAFGRENVSSVETVYTTTTSVVTSSNATTTTVTTTRDPNRTDFEIVITTGKGFIISGDIIPTGPEYIVTTTTTPEPTETTDPTEPTEPIEPTDPTEPIEPTDPTEPTEPTVEPTDPTESPVTPTEPPVVPSEVPTETPDLPPDDSGETW